MCKKLLPNFHYLVSQFSVFFIVIHDPKYTFVFGFLCNTKPLQSVVLVDQLEPIFSLVSSWHKLEFESWPSLLDEVQSHFEKNAAKVSFLYSFGNQFL